MRVMTHLMFQDGRAREAANLYVSLVDDGEVESTTEHEGAAIVQFRLGDQRFLAFDSPIRHEFGFTPSMSIHVTVQAAEDVDRLFAELAKDGSVLMPVGDYGFSSHYGWCTDRFGVSWQIGLPPA